MVIGGDAQSPDTVREPGTPVAAFLQPGEAQSPIPEVKMLTVGQEAPDFSIPNHNGVPVTMSELRGRPVLLWFYPKADTPG